MSPTCDLKARFCFCFFCPASYGIHQSPSKRALSTLSLSQAPVFAKSGANHFGLWLWSCHFLHCDDQRELFSLSSHCYTQSGFRVGTLVFARTYPRLKSRHSLALLSQTLHEPMLKWLIRPYKDRDSVKRNQNCKPCWSLYAQLGACKAPGYRIVAQCLWRLCLSKLSSGRRHLFS